MRYTHNVIIRSFSQIKQPKTLTDLRSIIWFSEKFSEKNMFTNKNNIIKVEEKSLFYNDNKRNHDYIKSLKTTEKNEL